MKMDNNADEEQKRLQASRQYWDDLAPSFDDEPDHGLRDSLALVTWTELLKTYIPNINATVLDIGCGTGSLSVILARLGHTVTGIDLSPSMISLAQAKAAAYGLEIELHIMDASHPQLAERQFDVIICRHLLWTLPEPEQVLQKWVKFLKPMGRLILIEGYWGTGAGLHAIEITEMLPSSFINISVQNLSNNPNFWGGNVTDERYIIIADLDPNAIHATGNMNNGS
jgi:ubiquinone/menaquinone biosynthesis C-methylase UbiE